MSQERLGNKISSGDLERQGGNRPGLIDLFKLPFEKDKNQHFFLQEILSHLDAATDEWGIRVERVEVWKMEKGDENGLENGIFLVRGNFNKFLVYFNAKTGERCEVATEPPESHGC